MSARTQVEQVKDSVVVKMVSHFVELIKPMQAQTKPKKSVYLTPNECFSSGIREFEKLQIWGLLFFKAEGQIKATLKLNFEGKNGTKYFENIGSVARYKGLQEYARKDESPNVVAILYTVELFNNSTLEDINNLINEQVEIEEERDTQPIPTQPQPQQTPQTPNMEGLMLRLIDKFEGVSERLEKLEKKKK